MRDARVGDMSWSLCENVEEFLGRRGDVLLSNESIHCLALGACERAQTSPADAPSYTFLTFEEAEVWSAHAIVMHASQALLMSDITDAQARALSASLTTHSIELKIAEGPERATVAFSEAWSRAHGRPYALQMDQGLYEVTQVLRPDPAGGSMVPVALEHEELLRAFLAGFHDDCFPGRPFPTEQLHTRVRRLIDEEKGVLWRDRDGALVAMAAVVRESQKTSSISLVYTPQEHRRRGHAGRLVGELSHEQLLSGKEACNLHADMKNATAHGVYTRLGYKKIAQSIRVDL